MRQHLPESHGLSGSSLKILAIASMFIDHVAATILYYNFLLPAAPVARDSSLWNLLILYEVMRTIGRIAFPIFCFLLVQGFLHTSSRSRYALRLLLFAFLSEIPFDWALGSGIPDWNYQNVFFTLFLGFLVLWGISRLEEKKNVFRLLLCFLLFILGAVLAALLKTDYSYWGILLIILLYIFRNQKILFTLAGCISLFWEAPACLAFFPIWFYNGKRGFQLKYVFYLFYPCHLLLLAVIRHLLAG